MKVLLLWLGEAAAAWAADQGDHEKQCATASWALARFIAILDEAGVFVSEEQAAELITAAVPDTDEFAIASACCVCMRVHGGCGVALARVL